MRSPGRVFWPLTAALVLADCTSKRVIEDTAPLIGVSRPVLDGVVRFTLDYNQGAAFSTYFGPYQRWVLIALTLGILGGLARGYRRITHTGWLGVAGLALVAGGAVGNLLDRLASDRGVVDFIDVGIGGARFYVFNIADAGVSVGAVLVAYAIWRSDAFRTTGPDSSLTDA